MAAFYGDALTLAGPAQKTAAKPIANLLTGEVARRLNDAGIGIEQSKLKPRHLADAARLAGEGTISSTGAKQVLAAAMESGEAVEALVERLGLRQVSDAGALEPIVDEVLAANAPSVADFRAGKE
jgi:aspartyl-tRNA(Asn)/glutamyl-tRNA(Gln) amidotransferase subunit B